MSKELEAFKTIKIKCHPNSNPSPLVDEALDIIGQSLQRLESIENAKPSEALECLHKIARKVELTDNDDYWEVRNAYSKVEQALLKAQEQEKVFEIIKEKRVNSYYFDIASDVKIYNNWIVILYGYPKEFLLTQEEFDLLKRWADE